MCAGKSMPFEKRGLAARPLTDCRGEKSFSPTELSMTPIGAGEVIFPPGKWIQPSGKVIFPPGKWVRPSGKVVFPPGKWIRPLGEGVFPPGKWIQPLGEVVFPSGKWVRPSGEDVFPPGKWIQPLGEVIFPPGKWIQPSGRVFYRSHTPPNSPVDKQFIRRYRDGTPLHDGCKLPCTGSASCLARWLQACLHDDCEPLGRVSFPRQL